MKRMWLVALLLSCSLLTGCAYGIAFAPQGQAADETIIELPKSATDNFLDAVIVAGKAQGYDVTGVSRQDKSASFGKIEQSLVTGSMMRVSLTVILTDPTHARISVNLAGNYGQGSQENAAKAIAAFKEKLLQTL